MFGWLKKLFHKELNPVFVGRADSGLWIGDYPKPFWRKSNAPIPEVIPAVQFEKATLEELHLLMGSRMTRQTKFRVVSEIVRRQNGEAEAKTSVIVCDIHCETSGTDACIECMSKAFRVGEINQNK